MQALRSTIWFIFLVIGFKYTEGQRFNFEYLTVKDGLSQNTISGITKDRYGFMWFGTWNGLCRYDGYKFKVYNNIPGDTTSLINNRIHYIYKDKDGTLWISTFNSGVCRYNYSTDNFTRFNLTKLPMAFRDSVNRLQNLSPFKYLSTILKQGMGEFKISSTGAHIVFKEPNNGRNGLNDNNVYCAYKDDNNMLWIGTATGGINKTDLMAAPFHIHSFTVSNNSSINVPIRTIFADSSGVWAGTQDKGLFFLDHALETDKRFITGTLTGDLRSIYKDSHGVLWLGYRTGLDKYDIKNNRIEHCFDGKEENFPHHFLAIAEDPVDGSIWFGTAKSVLRYDRQTNKFEKQSISGYEDNSSTTCLFFDSRNNLWIGTEYRGLAQFKRDTKTNRWTGCTNYISNGQKGNLPDNRVYSITEDQFGNIWAGSANGLCKINPQNGGIKIYTKADGLSDQYIAKLLPDSNGNIWISHKKGLSKLNVKTEAIANYSINDAFDTYEFMDGSGYADKTTGKLYFGGTNGFVSFYPKEITSNPYPPTVVLTELRVLNRALEAGQEINGRMVLSTPLYLTKKLTLTHLDRSFSIEFAALQYSAPEKNQYAYMLEGVDKDWVHTDASNRIANYSNLPAGKYIFKVKGSNSDGLWNPVATVLEINILPPWWATWWAYLAYFILSVLAILAVFRLVMIRQKYNQEILIERLKAEKAQELEETKSRFFTNISHEFRTPLTLIIGPLKDLLSGKFPKEKLSDYYGIMHRNAQRLLSLINQFLDLRKLETGHLQLRPSKQDVIANIRHVMSSFEFQATQKRIDFQFHSPIERFEFVFDIDVLDKVLFNLLSNAFKFTEVRGKITVSLLDFSPETVKFSVNDNGPGIPAELKDKIFEPFYQVEGTVGYNTTGTGVGLSLIRELVLLHKGNIEVHSQPDIETSFTVTLKRLELNAPGSAILPMTVINEPGDSQPVIFETTEAETGQAIVLIAEDNFEVRQYLQFSLMDEYKVIITDNGLEGLEKAVEIIPDIIISDIMMPEMDGIEFCRKIKSDERTSHIPVILLTARQSEKYQTEGFESGADDYIGKPFSTALLLVRIKNLLASRKKLRQLFEQSTGFNPRVIGTNAADKAFINRMTDLIETHMSDPMFSVDWLASQLHLSRTQLYRKIKALTAQTAQEYVTTIRLNKAAALLMEGSLSVAEIARTVGYSEPSNFSRSFQKQFNQTPKKFAQQGKNISEHDESDL